MCWIFGGQIVRTQWMKNQNLLNSGSFLFNLLNECEFQDNTAS